MALQGYCTILSHPEPFAKSGGGTAALRVHVLHQMHVVWAGAGTDVIDPPTDCISAYDSSTIVDGSQFVWIVCLIQGGAQPILAKELDVLLFPTLGALSAPWAPVARIDGDQLYMIPQV